jgi:hypothetical protein
MAAIKFKKAELVGNNAVVTRFADTLLKNKQEHF